MSDSVTAQAAAGVSLLFSSGERPDVAAWRSALGACQARAQMVHADAVAGSGELVVDGLTFDVDGLAPASGAPAPSPNGDGSGEFAVDGLEAVRLYPGHHLSGGIGMTPVVRALLALAAEIGLALPVRAVWWQPAQTIVEPQAFARATLAWLAGGSFPTDVLTSLTMLADGSVVSEGLAHFVGQEVTLRPRSGESPEQAMRLAEQTVDYLVRHGRVVTITEVAISGEMVCFEPAQRGDHLWVWRKAS